MSSYTYNGYDSGGHACRGWVEASSPKHARVLLRGQGIVAESVRAAAEIPGKRRAGSESRERLYREVGVLLESGLPLERALTLTMENGDAGAALRAAALRDAVRDGDDFAKACDKVCGGLPAEEKAILRAAELSGTLDRMCLTLAETLEASVQLRSRVRSMLLYPAFVLVLGLAVAFLMGGVLAPGASRMLVALRGEAPLRAMRMLHLARWFSWGLLLMPVLGLAVYFRGRRLVRRSEDFRISLERRGLRVPVLRRLLVSFWSARFARVLALLVGAGAPLVEGMALAGEASGSRLVAGMAREQAEAIEHGARLSEAMGRIPALREVLVEWVRIGETGGSLVSLLQQASRRLDADFERRLGRLLAWIEPGLILLIGLFVMLVALTVLVPMLTVAREVIR